MESMSPRWPVFRQASSTRARQVLAELERQRRWSRAELQLGLPIELAPDPLRKELEDLEPDSLSPLEALQKLYQLRAKLSHEPANSPARSRDC